MRYLRKEFKLVYSNRSFVVFYTFVSLLFIAVGYSLRFLLESFKSSFVSLYFSTIYSFILSYFILNLYPIGENVREQINGGVENLLATPLGLGLIILSKSLVVFFTLYIPVLLFLSSIFIWSQDLTTFLLSILFYTSLILVGSF
ncbi:hypothetical protein FY122_09360 [Dictyoglomus thermophilum]|uniref:hypothetical protein n=1 Tax=Dictyoglomus thermophilum TaxID=14 RepID=UPI0011EADBE4|nr:hypothetical protein [Dictyoglomus thermophilum]TYT20328.1 hypothetical protein FY122_09360 [Dictyoglomus thermophilum]